MRTLPTLILALFVALVSPACDDEPSTVSDDLGVDAPDGSADTSVTVDGTANTGRSDVSGSDASDLSDVATEPPTDTLPATDTDAADADAGATVAGELTVYGGFEAVYPLADVASWTVLEGPTLGTLDETVPTELVYGAWEVAEGNDRVLVEFVFTSGGTAVHDIAVSIVAHPIARFAGVWDVAPFEPPASFCEAFDPTSFEITLDTDPAAPVRVIGFTVSPRAYTIEFCSPDTSSQPAQSFCFDADGRIFRGCPLEWDARPGIPTTTAFGTVTDDAIDFDFRPDESPSTIVTFQLDRVAQTFDDSYYRSTIRGNAVPR